MRNLNRDEREEWSDECEEEMSVSMGRGRYASVCETRLAVFCANDPDLTRIEANSSLATHLTAQ